MRTEGFCSAPLRSRNIRDKVRNGILALFRDQLYFSATKQRRTKSFGTHIYNTSNNTSTKLQLQQIKLHIEIVNLNPVTPTRIRLLAWQGAPLESVSLCTRFSGFSTIYSFGFNRLFELKIGRHVLWNRSNVLTRGFCSGLLCRADMHQNVRARLNSRISARRSNLEQNP